MKRILPLIIFLLSGISLLSQPVIDTVRPGIKLVKKLICGYKQSDSTGLVIVEVREYNLNGHMTKYIYEMRDYIYSVEDSDVETEAKSYYYYGYSSPDQRYDTVPFEYKYDAKSRVTKVTKRDYDKKIRINSYAYDANGNIISEVQSTDGIEIVRYDWNYNANGDLLSKWEKRAKAPAKKTVEQKYDAQNRIVKKSLFSFSVDSTLYSYPVTGKQELMYIGDVTFVRNQYDTNDSLISRAIFKRIYKDGDYFGWVLYDTAYIKRNQAGVRVSRYYTSYFERDAHTSTEKYDTLGRQIVMIINKNGKDVRKITNDYNDSLHIRVYKRYGIHDKSKADLYGKDELKEEIIYSFNAKNQLSGVRRMNSKGQLLERIVYQYTYY